jgi:hypothetical protein
MSDLIGTAGDVVSNLMGAATRGRARGATSGQGQTRSSGGSPGAAGGSDSFSGTLDRLFDAFGDFVRAAGDTARGAAQGAADTLGDIVPPRAGEDLSTSVRAGECVELKLALHNTGNVPLKDVRFTSTELIAGMMSGNEPTFKTLPANGITFGQQVLSRIRAGTSDEMTMKIDVPSSQPQAVYRGLVFAYPGNACIPIAVTVLPAKPTASQTPPRKRPRASAAS